MIKALQLGQARWSGVGLIAATYLYFLIFAQFGFLHRVRESLGQEYWNVVLGVMGLAGILGALFTWMRYRSGAGRAWLTVSFVGAGGGAFLAGIGLHLSVFVLSAFISGFFLSTLTVSLIAVLAEMLPLKEAGLVCGLGTGVAYFLSNVPVLFEASPLFQCLAAVLACLFGVVCAMQVPVGALVSTAEARRSMAPERRASAVESNALRYALPGWILIFMILVWSDSAAFTRIQETPELKAASWSGAGNLWSIGIVHLVAAIFAGYLLDSGRFKWLFLLAFAGLLLGWLGLEHAFAGVLPACVYAAAVSFYSTALVGFALVRSRGLSPVLLAAGVFGVSGWVGSAMGIGMVNDLGRLPLGFWAVAVVFLVLGIFLTERKVAQ